MTSPDLPRALSSWLQTQPEQYFAAGETLAAPEAAPSHLWWLRSGLVRVYSLDPDGDVYNLDFCTSGEWVSGRLLWRDGAICCSDRAIGVEALQETHAVRVRIADIDALRAADPDVAAWVIDALMRLAANRLGRETDLAQRSAEQRYRDLIMKQPGLLASVPLRQIAAWLGITPVALSRIRRRMSTPR